MSVGSLGVFIPASSTSLIGVGHHDAGVASAVLNTAQQIGGSLGTALLNTIFAGAVTSYLADKLTDPADAARLGPLALIHGYTVSFLWGSILFWCPADRHLRDQRPQGGRPDRGCHCGLTQRVRQPTGSSTRPRRRSSHSRPSTTPLGARCRRRS